VSKVSRVREWSKILVAFSKFFWQFSFFTKIEFY
jgi:hypothetical protein